MKKNIPEIAESVGMSILDLRTAYFGALIKRSKTITIQGQTFKVDDRHITTKKEK